MCTSELNSSRLGNLRGASSLLQEPCFQRSKPKGELKAEGRAILSCLRLGMLPAGQIRSRLRKMEGIKEVRINHVSHTVKIRYDPSIVTIEKIRTVLKGMGSGTLGSNSTGADNAGPILQTRNRR
jgi:copper chaperone CopZ